MIEHKWNHCLFPFFPFYAQSLKWASTLTSTEFVSHFVMQLKHGTFLCITEVNYYYYCFFYYKIRHLLGAYWLIWSMPGITTKLMSKLSAIAKALSNLMDNVGEKYFPGSSVVSYIYYCCWFALYLAMFLVLWLKKVFIVVLVVAFAVATGQGFGLISCSAMFTSLPALLLFL